MSKEIIEYICPYCGNDKSYLLKLENVEGGECTKCGKLTFHKRINNINSEPEVKCPYCGSLNTKKITKASKAGSIALWGIFAIGKSTKEWHCNRCNSDF